MVAVVVDHVVGDVRKRVRECISVAPAKLAAQEAAAADLKLELSRAELEAIIGKVAVVALAAQWDVATEVVEGSDGETRRARV